MITEFAVQSVVDDLTDSGRVIDIFEIFNWKTAAQIDHPKVNATGPYRPEDTGRLRNSRIPPRTLELL